MSDELRFRVDTSDLTRAVRALDQVAHASQGTEKAAGRLRDAQGRYLPVARETTQAVTQQTRAVGQLGGAMGRTGGAASQLAGLLRTQLGAAVAGVATLEALRRTAMLADEYQRMGARLRVVSQSAGQAAAAQQSLVKLALETRSPLLATVTLFARTAAASKELGVSQDRVLNVTRAVAQSFQVSGASAAEASSSAQQFAQALGSGTLSGDELRSILENNLVLAEAIAKQFGVSVGQLRKMGEEGKLSSRGIFQAIERESAPIGKQFALIPANLETATTNLKTALQAMLGRLDSAVGLTAAIARNMDAAAKAMPAAADRTVSYFENLKRSLPAYLGGTDTDDRRSAFGALVGRGMDPDAPARPLVRRAGVLDTVRVTATGPKVLTPEERARAAREQLQRITRTIDAAGELAARALETATDTADEMQRRRIAAGLETGDPVADGQRAQLEGRIRRELAAGAPAFGRRDLSGGPSSLRDASLVQAERLREQLQQRAEELRRTFTDQLTRGVQDGLSAPIARFLRTWQLNVKTMGDALRDALINAVSAALANALTRRLVELFDRMTPKTSAVGVAAQLASGLVGGGTRGGFGGFAGGSLPIPGLRLPFGGGGSAAGGIGNVAKAGALKNGAAAGKTLTMGGGLLAGGIGLGVGGLVGRRFGTGAGVAGGALAGAGVGFAVGGPVGALVGGLAGLVGGIGGGRARRRARAERAESSRSFLEELGIRGAAAGGDDARAERLRMEASQRQELAEATKRFGSRSTEVSRLRETQAAELRRLTDDALGSGTYLAPEGFEANRFRFEAGRPMSGAIASGAGGAGSVLQGATVNITVPVGTTADQARALLDEFGRLATAQGLPASDWSRIQ
jgi:tape measure domain-containing protein